MIAAQHDQIRQHRGLGLCADKRNRLTYVKTLWLQVPAPAPPHLQGPTPSRLPRPQLP